MSLNTGPTRNKGYILPTLLGKCGGCQNVPGDQVSAPLRCATTTGIGTSLNIAVTWSADDHHGINRPYLPYNSYNWPCWPDARKTGEDSTALAAIHISYGAISAPACPSQTLFLQRLKCRVLSLWHGTCPTCALWHHSLGLIRYFRDRVIGPIS